MAFANNSRGGAYLPTTARVPSTATYDPFLDAVGGGIEGGVTTAREPSLVATLRALRQRGAPVSEEMLSILESYDAQRPPSGAGAEGGRGGWRGSGGGSSNAGAGTITPPQPSGFALLLCAFCFGSGVLLLFFAYLFGGALPAFVVPAIHHGWSQEEKSRGCRRAAILYFLLAGLFFFWGYIMGWCRWRLCVLFNLRVDHVGRKVLGHQRYYRLRGRHVPASPSDLAQSRRYEDGDGDDHSSERGRLLSGVFRGGGGGVAADGSSFTVEMKSLGITEEGGTTEVRRRGVASSHHHLSDAGSAAFGESLNSGPPLRQPQRLQQRSSNRSSSSRSPASPASPLGPGGAGPNNGEGLLRRALRRVLLPSANAPPQRPSTSSGGGGGASIRGRGGQRARGAGGISVNQEVRDTLDPDWMSDGFLKQLVRYRK